MYKVSALETHLVQEVVLIGYGVFIGRGCGRPRSEITVSVSAKAA